MKRHEKNIEEIVDTHLRLFRSPPVQEITRAYELTLQELRCGTSAVPQPAAAPYFSAQPVWRLRWAVAAAIMIAVVIPAAMLWQGSAPAVLESSRGVRKIQFGEVIQASGADDSILVLRDGSRVEMRAKSEIALEKAEDGVRIRLNAGSVIVTAAKQRYGHLYVQTKDVTVSVVGTIFLVKAEKGGSRVAVIQGEVHVRQGETTRSLLPGEQLRTNPKMEQLPVKEELSWSSRAETHLALLEQSIAISREGPKLRFEVISIKPSLATLASRFACRGIDGTLEPIAGPGMMLSAFQPVMANGQVREGPLSVPNGRCVGQLGFVHLVGIAYDLPTRNVSGVPQWAQNVPGGQRFQIETKAEDVANVTKEQLRQMLQGMLADRFKLTFHWETRESQGYALLVAPSGTKLKDASGDEELPHLEIGTAGERIIKGKSSLKKLADFLLGFVSFGTTAAPIVDKTQLPGRYEYTLILHPAGGQGGGPRGGGGNIGGNYDPPVSTALQEQLGLTLEPLKIQAETIAIDSVEKPSGN